MIIHVCSLEPNEGNQGYQPCFWWSQPEIFQCLIHVNPAWLGNLLGHLPTFFHWSTASWTTAGPRSTEGLGVRGPDPIWRWTHRRSPWNRARGATGFSVSMAQSWISDPFCMALAYRKGPGVLQGSSKIHWIRTEFSTFFHSHWEVYRILHFQTHSYLLQTWP